MTKLHRCYYKNRVENRTVRTVEQTIATYKMFQPNDSVIAGVSGGPDSVALLYLLLSIASRFHLKLGIAHLNHCLRRHDSDNDAEFVAYLAQKLNLPFFTKKENVFRYKKKHKLSLEEAARQVRYKFYYSLLENEKFNKIALGHHIDDNAELILMNLFRGTGFSGLSGIPPVRDNKIVRPLMGLSRTEILDYLAARGLRYVLDASNRDTRHLRNKIRLHLIPALKTSCNPKIVETLNRNAAILRCENEWIENSIKHIFEKAVLLVHNNRIILSVSLISETDTAAKRRIIRKAIEKIKGNLRRITFFHIDSVIHLLGKGAGPGSLDLPDGIRIEQHSGKLIISVKENKKSRTDKSEKTEILSYEYKITKPGLKPVSIFIRKTGKELKFSAMNVKDLPDIRHAGNKTAFIDMDALRFPLMVRNFLQGDRFTPLGMTGSQKIKKFFINNKIPRIERLKYPVVLSGEKVIWIAGLRLDNCFKIKNSTVNVLKIELFLA